jgi:hypothetical protein
MKVRKVRWASDTDLNAEAKREAAGLAAIEANRSVRWWDLIQERDDDAHAVARSNLNEF